MPAWLSFSTFRAVFSSCSSLIFAFYLSIFFLYFVSISCASPFIFSSPICISYISLALISLNFSRVYLARLSYFSELALRSLLSSYRSLMVCLSATISSWSFPASLGRIKLLSYLVAHTGGALSLGAAADPFYLEMPANLLIFWISTLRSLICSYYWRANFLYSISSFARPSLSICEFSLFSSIFGLF